MRFKQNGAIYTLTDRRLKLVDEFTYFSSNLPSTESDINIRLFKAWSVIDWFSIIWKPDLYDKIKGFFTSCSCVNTSVWMHHIVTNKTYCKKARGYLHKNTTWGFKQIPNIPQKAAERSFISNL